MTKVKYEKRLSAISPANPPRPHFHSDPSGVAPRYFPTEQSWIVYITETRVRLNWRSIWRIHVS
jgi:hypothetical protein